MPYTVRRGRRSGTSLRFAIVAVAIAATFALSSAAFASVRIKVVSRDPYTNTTSYHATEVEPDTYSNGSTLVATFQVGRFTDGGASNLGWTTSTDGGNTWQHGFLPGTTVFANPPGTFKRATDPAVTYDASHGVWMVAGLLSKATSGFNGDTIFVSRSTDGGLTWGNPVSVQNASGGQDWDKSWIGCDNWPTSPNFGHCYAEWDDFGSGNILHLSTSTDGGQTWNPASVPNGTIVIGGQPLAQPNGTVIVPTDDGFESSAEAFISKDGGVTYTGPFTIDFFNEHFVAGGLRAPNLLSADVDSSGTIYVVWYDCRFRTNCSSNDIVMSTSANGKTWTPAVRVPIDPTSSTVDHFLMGIAADPATGGATAHLGLTYSFYPNANCTASTCQLTEGFIESTDGGATWGAAQTLAGPFTNTWLPNTSQGYMTGDYQSTSFLSGRADTVFIAARLGTCQLGQITSCIVPAVAPKRPIASTGPFVPSGTDRVAIDRGWYRPARGLASSN